MIWAFSWASSDGNYLLASGVHETEISRRYFLYPLGALEPQVIEPEPLVLLHERGPGAVRPGYLIARVHDHEPAPQEGEYDEHRRHGNQHREVKEVHILHIPPGPHGLSGEDARELELFAYYLSHNNLLVLNRMNRKKPSLDFFSHTSRIALQT